MLALLPNAGENTIMYEILIRIETLCHESSTLALAGSGALLLVIGLLLWLAGSYYSSVILGLLGAVVGAGCGLLVSQWLELSLLISTSVGAVIFTIAAVLFKNALIIILAAIVFALAGGTTYSGFILKDTAPQTSAELNSALIQPFSSLDSDNRLIYTNQVTQSGRNFLEKLKLLINDALETMDPFKWKILLSAVGGGIGGLLLIWFIKNFILALCYSGVGTFLLLIGLEIGLLAVNIRFCSLFEERRPAFTITFLSMLLFGALFQLIVTRSKKKKTENEKVPDNS